MTEGRVSLTRFSSSEVSEASEKSTRREGDLPRDGWVGLCRLYEVSDQAVVKEIFQKGHGGAVYKRVEEHFRDFSACGEDT